MALVEGLAKGERVLSKLFRGGEKVAFREAERLLPKVHGESAMFSRPIRSAAKSGMHGESVMFSRPVRSPVRPGGTSTPIRMGPTRRGPMHGPPAPRFGPKPKLPGGPVPVTMSPPKVMHGPFPNPPKAPGLFAKHGKKVAAAVAAGTLGGAIMTRRGKAVDSQTGLPTGIYNR